MIDINQKDFGTLCICALRYCHGRRTYMPSEVQRIVSEHFCDLSSRDLAVIEQDKSFQSHMDMWGDQCDKADWLRFYKELEKFRKTENNSEKPNNSTISKMEQVDKDINVRSKDEPQTNGYQTFNGTGVYVSRLEDEPQTDCAWK